jgi:putative SOS response-associated peptidase YedK
MPVILAPADFDRWLDTKAAKGPELQELLRPYPAEAMTAYPVDTRVNGSKHNDAACVAPLAGRGTLPDSADPGGDAWVKGHRPTA